MRRLTVRAHHADEKAGTTRLRVRRSPTHPAVFATAAGTGQVDLWNLNKNVEVRTHASGLRYKSRLLS